MAVRREPEERKPRLIGEHLHFDRCRFCYSLDMHPVIDFGDVPLAGGFLPRGSTPDDFARERKYPLQICFCRKCCLLQVNNVIGIDVLFKNYFYFSSAIKTLADHFDRYAGELAALYPATADRLVAEIGCNDGVFIKPLKTRGFRVVGIDPATNVVKPLIESGFDVVNAGFTEEIAREISATRGKADVIVTSNSFAHIDDMHTVMRGIKALLKPDGFLAVEVHYLGTLMDEVQYDMMYHEHQSYYSLLALTNFFGMYDMEVFDIRRIPIHAGSMRYYVQNKRDGGRRVTKAVRDLARAERKMGLDRRRTFERFSAYIHKVRKNLLALLGRLKRQGKRIAGYGASGRATAIMSFCGIDRRHLDYVIDDAPAKQGAFTPGNHLPIRSSDVLRDAKERPDYCLVFAWSFIDEIRKRNGNYLASGGKFIVPLPSVKTVSD